MTTTNTNTMETLAMIRYPTNARLRADYIHALKECKTNPAYQVRMPNGLDDYPCHCEPFMEDDTKGWTTVKRKIRVKKILSEEELEYLAAQMHDNWEADSVDSRGGMLNYTSGPVGEHNGALFDIGSRF